VQRFAAGKRDDACQSHRRAGTSPRNTRLSAPAAPSKFEFDTDPTFVAVCHCLDCKKASGGEAATFFGVPEDDFTLISGEPKTFHYVGESGKGLDRNFCPIAAPGSSPAIWRASRE
jgi:hypothetical protein